MRRSAGWLAAALALAVLAAVALDRARDTLAAADCTYLANLADPQVAARYWEVVRPAGIQADPDLPIAVNLCDGMILAYPLHPLSTFSSYPVLTLSYPGLEPVETD